MPVYLNRIKTFEHNHIFFTLGKERKYINKKNAERALGICYWKFSKGHYYTKPWEDFLGSPIHSSGTIWVMDQCSDHYCGTTILRDPNSPKIHCDKCNRTYYKPYLDRIDTGLILKYIVRMKGKCFCHSCGTLNAPWTNSDTRLCYKCFIKYGDHSFQQENNTFGTKITFPADMMLTMEGK